jgi:hypothetical protein
MGLFSYLWVAFPICGSLFVCKGRFSQTNVYFHKCMSPEEVTFLKFFNGFLFWSMGLVHVYKHDRHRFPFCLFSFLFFFWTEFRFCTTHHEPPRIGCAQKSHKPANFVFVTVTILLFDRIQIWLGTSRTLASDSRTQMTAALWFSLWKPLKRCLFPHELAHFFHTSPRFVTLLKFVTPRTKTDLFNRQTCVTLQPTNVCDIRYIRMHCIYSMSTLRVTSFLRVSTMLRLYRACIMFSYVKRDPDTCQKRPVYMSKETSNAEAA